MDNKSYDVVIIGGGAAGMTAGIYVARNGLKAVIIEKMYAGGQFVNANEIENMPGFESVSGYDLSIYMLKQTEKSDCEIIYDEVVGVNYNTLTVNLAGGNTFQARAIVLAMGATPRPLGIENESRFISRGIHYCATCDGNFYKNKVVAVVGGGNTALADAKHLARIASKVYLIHRRDTLRAKGVEIEYIASKDNVEILYDTVIKNLILNNNKIAGAVVENVKNSESRSISLDGIFVAVGWLPNVALAGELVKDEYGYIITDADMRTNYENVYAVGDVRSKNLRQIVTAAADGAIAGDDIGSKLV